MVRACHGRLRVGFLVAGSCWRSWHPRVAKEGSWAGWMCQRRRAMRAGVAIWELSEEQRTSGAMETAAGGCRAPAAKSTVLWGLYSTLWLNLPFKYCNQQFS